jgi:hypothetical protein
LVTIPKDLRDENGVEASDEVEIEMSEGTFQASKLGENWLIGPGTTLIANPVGTAHSIQLGQTKHQNANRGLAIIFAVV